VSEEPLAEDVPLSGTLLLSSADELFPCEAEDESVEELLSSRFVIVLVTNVQPANDRISSMQSKHVVIRFMQLPP